MEPYAAPEILSADLSGLVLDLAAWGARDPACLAWLDAPPAPAVKEARALLRDLDALDAEGAITDEGRAIRALPLPPRLARMVVDAARAGEAALAAQIALVLVERGLGGEAGPPCHWQCARTGQLAHTNPLTAPCSAFNSSFLAASSASKPSCAARAA
jgi:HrpA-like RNA helicase